MWNDDETYWIFCKFCVICLINFWIELSILMVFVGPSFSERHFVLYAEIKYSRVLIWLNTNISNQKTSSCFSYFGAKKKFENKCRYFLVYIRIIVYFVRIFVVDFLQFGANFYVKQYFGLEINFVNILSDKHCMWLVCKLVAYRHIYRNGINCSQKILTWKYKFLRQTFYDGVVWVLVCVSKYFWKI